MSSALRAKDFPIPNGLFNGFIEIARYGKLSFFPSRLERGVASSKARQAYRSVSAKRKKPGAAPGNAFRVHRLIHDLSPF